MGSCDTIMMDFRSLLSFKICSDASHVLVNIDCKTNSFNMIRSFFTYKVSFFKEAIFKFGHSNLL